MEENTQPTDAINNGESSTPQPEENKTVPLERFNEVYGNWKQTEAKLSTIESEIASLKEKRADEGLSDTEKQELEAKQYLKNMILETQKEQREQESKAKSEELAQFAKEVDNALVDSGVKKDEFLKFLEEEADEYEFGSVKAAMKFYKSYKVANKPEEKDKPSLPNSDSNPNGKESYDDKGKSFKQVLNEISKQAK